MFHPWRHLRSLGDKLTLSCEPTPGNRPGWYSPENRHILLNDTLLQVERRCALAHELAHFELEHSGYCTGPEQGRLTRRQEIQADVQAALWLLPDVVRIGDALTWAHTVSEAADELWVTEHLLTVRLVQLPDRQKLELRERLATLGR